MRGGCERIAARQKGLMMMDTAACAATLLGVVGVLLCGVLGLP